MPLLPLVVLAVCATSPASAALLAVDAEGPAVTDGRSIAFSPRPGAIRVVTGAAARDVDVASTCGQLLVRVNAIGAGQVLYSCGADASPMPQRLDLASLETHPVPGAAGVIEANGQATVPYGVSFDGIGSVGVSYLSSVYHGGVVGALDWRTGAGVVDSLDATRVIDLDQEDLTAELCAPLRRVATGPGAETPFWPFQYRAPYGLAEGERLVLHRCGSARRVVLSRTAWSPQLGARLVAWIDARAPARDRRRANAYVLACGRRVSWKAAYGSSVVPLARSVVISEPLHYPGPWRIRQMSVRGACRHASARR